MNTVRKTSGLLLASTAALLLAGCTSTAEKADSKAEEAKTEVKKDAKKSDGCGGKNGCPSKNGCPVKK
ncbi:MAG: hypothetical protein ACWA5U_00680 [bacterium]